MWSFASFFKRKWSTVLLHPFCFIFLTLSLLRLSRQMTEEQQQEKSNNNDNNYNNNNNENHFLHWTKPTWVLPECNKCFITLICLLRWNVTPAGQTMTFLKIPRLLVCNAQEKECTDGCELQRLVKREGVDINYLHVSFPMMLNMSMYCRFLALERHHRACAAIKTWAYIRWLLKKIEKISPKHQPFNRWRQERRLIHQLKNKTFGQPLWSVYLNLFSPSLSYLVEVIKKMNEMTPAEELLKSLVGRLIPTRGHFLINL